jgi:hypothetical protein
MNTISTYSYRRKYRMSTLDTLLRKALIAEKICAVDRSDGKYIDSPYGSQPTTTIQSIAGTYSTAAYTLTDDTLTVTDEFIVAEHIYDFEQVLTAFDVFANRIDEQNNSIKENIDKFVLNNLCEDATGTYTTPAGGFTTPANVNVILTNLVAKLAGYSDTMAGMYLVIENTDIPGFMQSQAAQGFSFADMALKNGFMDSMMGVDIYVVRSGTFVSATLGTTTVTNDNHRVFGPKKAATYAAPRGVRYEEKSVAGKTGKEVVTWGYIGFKLWKQKLAVTIDITLA